MNASRLCVMAERRVYPAMNDESFSAHCRRVLENGPAGADDYEVACYLIGQGLADGRCGPPSKGRDTYGKITQVFWRCPTAAGRLWLEQQSAGAKLDEPEVIADQQANHGAQQLESEALKPLVEAIARLPEPQPNLVKLAWGLAVVVLGAMVILLLKTHLGISL